MTGMYSKSLGDPVSTLLVGLPTTWTGRSRYGQRWDDEGWNAFAEAVARKMRGALGETLDNLLGANDLQYPN